MCSHTCTVVNNMHVYWSGIAQCAGIQYLSMRAHRTLPHPITRAQCAPPCPGTRVHNVLM